MDVPRSLIPASGAKILKRPLSQDITNLEGTMDSGHEGSLNLSRTTSNPPNAALDFPAAVNHKFFAGKQPKKEYAFPANDTSFR